MTYEEITKAIEGNQRRVKAEFEINATLAYKMGSLVGIAVNDPKQYPTLKEAFLGLFQDLDTAPKQQPWQIMKDRIESYNQRLKQKRGEAN